MKKALSLLMLVIGIGAVGLLFRETKPKQEMGHGILKKESNFEDSPIGDNQHREVYSFIEQALMASKQWSQANIQKLRETEIKHQDDRDFKPLMADIAESELASLLAVLLKAQPSYYEITLYQKDGVGIATAAKAQYSVLITPRNMDFTIGILSPETMQEPKVYTYQTHDSSVCYEYLKAIYHHKTSTGEGYSYLGFSKNNADDSLIGYVSYLAQ